jgi:hypothetical protein
MNIQELSEQLSKVDSDLILEEVRKSHIHCLDKEGIYAIFDKRDKDPRRKSIGYVDLQLEKYYDGESINGGPYAVGGRKLELSKAVFGLFRGIGWEASVK